MKLDDADRRHSSFWHCIYQIDRARYVLVWYRNARYNGDVNEYRKYTRLASAVRYARRWKIPAELIPQAVQSALTAQQ